MATDPAHPPRRTPAAPASPLNAGSTHLDTFRAMADFAAHARTLRIALVAAATLVVAACAGGPETIDAAELQAAADATLAIPFTYELSLETENGPVSVVGGIHREAGVSTMEASAGGRTNETIQLGPTVFSRTHGNERWTSTTLTSPPPASGAEALLHLLAVTTDGTRVPGDGPAVWEATVDMDAAHDRLVSEGGTVDARSILALSALEDVVVTTTLTEDGTVSTVTSTSASDPTMNQTMTITAADEVIDIEVPDPALVDSDDPPGTPPPGPAGAGSVAVQPGAPGAATAATPPITRPAIGD